MGWFPVAALLISAAGLPAQSRDTERKILDQLDSNDYAELAWGAYSAGEEGLTQLTPKIVPLLGLRDPRLQAVAIDALIRLRADVPEQSLVELVETGQLDPVLILLSRNPERHTDFLMRLLDGPLTGLQWVAVNNLLSAEPPPGFAAKLLREWKIKYTLTVHEKSPYASLGEGSGFGSMGVRGKTDSFPGFPPIFVDTIHQSFETGDSVLVQEPFPLYFRRGQTYTSDSADVNRDALRPGYVRYLARAAKDDPAVRLPSKPQFEWVDSDKYRSDAAGLLEAIRRPVKVIVDRLIALGLLTDSDAGSGPKLDVRVYDARGSHAVPLPMIDWNF